MISSAKRLVEENNLSSLHITFCSKSFVSVAKKNNLLVREGIQYHWSNRDYKSFDDFLGSSLLIISQPCSGVIFFISSFL